MGRYLGSWKLEDIVYVPVQTSSITTGAATDAETLPTWQMYEDNTATPVTTGSFASLNSQTGFYMAAITLAAASGYEKGRSYSLRVSATVGGIIGADVHALQIEAEVDANAVSTLVALAAGAITAGTITSGALVASKFGNGFIGASSFSTGAINASAIAASAVDIMSTVNATARAAIAVAVWDEPKASHTTADTYGVHLDSTTSAIKTETAAIKAKTDLIFAGTTGSLKADIRFVNGVSITGNGQSGTEWGPGS